MAWVLGKHHILTFSACLLAFHVVHFLCHFLCIPCVSTVAAFHYPNLPLPSMAQLGVHDRAWQYKLVRIACGLSLHAISSFDALHVYKFPRLPRPLQGIMIWELLQSLQTRLQASLMLLLLLSWSLLKLMRHVTFDMWQLLHDT